MKALDELKSVRDYLLGDNSLSQHEISQALKAHKKHEERMIWAQKNLHVIENDIDSLSFKQVNDLYNKHHHPLNHAITISEETRSANYYADLANQLVQSLPSGSVSSSNCDAATGSNSIDANHITLSEVWDLYMVEMVKSGNWAPASKREYDSGKNIVTQLIPNQQLCKIDKATIRTLKENLGRLPANANKIKEFKGLSLYECIKLTHSHNLISITTINKYLNQMKAVLSWSIDNGFYQGTNPVLGMMIKKRKDALSKRTPFNRTDLGVICKDLIGKLDANKKNKEPHKFWLPLIALYTGARINEICQLHLTDIKFDKIPHISINNDTQDKTLKNTNSKRIIPIHQKLIDIGFKEYVDSLKSSDAVRLFPNLKRSRDGYGSAPSKFFGREFRKLGFDQTKVFHSFRHTFANDLKNIGVQEAIVANMLGHTHNTMTFGHYGAEAKLNTMKVELEKLDYDDVIGDLRW